MKQLILAVCVGTAMATAGCRHARYEHHSTSVSTTLDNEEYKKVLVNHNGHYSCAYYYKTADYSCEVKSNGPLEVRDGAVQSLQPGQQVELMINEAGRDYNYRVVRLGGVPKPTLEHGAWTDQDEARLQRALQGLQRQLASAPANAETVRRQAQGIRTQADKQAQAARRQADAVRKQAELQAERAREQAQRQAELLQQAAERQAHALQKQAELFQRQAEIQAEALQKQAEALERQAEAMEKQFSK